MKSDWSDIDHILKQGKSDEPGASWSSEDVGLNPETTRDGVPAELPAHRLTAAQAEQNLLTRFRAASIRREAALTMLGQLVKGHVEAFGHQVNNAVVFQKTKSDVEHKARLMELEARELETLREGRIRNEEARFQTLLESDEKFTALLKDARERDIPDTWLHENIRDLAEIRRRLRAQINEDIGLRHRHKPE